MSIINFFDLNNLGFSLADTVEAINLLPNRYSRITELGLFSDVPLHTNTATIELKDNSLSILPTVPWGSPGVGSGPTKREIKSLVIPQTMWQDTVLAADVMGIRRFGTENVLETIQEKVLEKLQQAKDMFDMTDEYRKISALKGEVVDSDGVTPLFNSFNFFGITKKSIDFNLGNPTEEIPQKILNLKRHMEDHLRGETMQYIRVFVGPTFYDKLIQHPKIKEIWLNWSGAPGRLASDLRKGFELEGVIFEEYRGIVPKPDGTGTLKFIEDNYGIAIPVGTRNTFKRFVAPADYTDTVNTLGKPYYAKQRPMEDDRGILLSGQSNTLPICLRPKLLIEVKTTT
jgi:hypothetical protein